MVGVEKIEELLEGGVGDANLLAVEPLDLVPEEQPAVEIGHGAQQLVRRGGALLLALGKALEEQRAEELPVVAIAAAQLALDQLVRR